MQTQMQVPSEYGYVFVSGIASVLLGFWLGSRVGFARKTYGVKYPIMYATKDDVKDIKHMHEFNALQRGHGNYLETLPTFLVTLFISGLTTPIYSSIAGGLWVGARILYALGYTGENPNGRYKGAFQFAALVYLLGGACFTTYKLLASN